MCGRIAQTHTPDELSELLGVTSGLDQLDGIAPSYNVPPSAQLPGLIAENNVLEWSTFTWGLLPVWKKDGRAMINARSETVAQKPMFRRAFKHRRCVFPVTAYYEWLPQPGRPKQPYCIRPQAEEQLLLAGIYENGRCAILTRAAREDFAFIHDRMPVALPRDLVDLYLTAEQPSFVFEAAEDLALHAYPVTRLVGNPRFNDPSCLEPLSS